jgi:hypothetical protein
LEGASCQVFFLIKAGKLGRQEILLEVKDVTNTEQTERMNYATESPSAVERAIFGQEK